MIRRSSSDPVATNIYGKYSITGVDSGRAVVTSSERDAVYENYMKTTGRKLVLKKDLLKDNC